MDFDFSGMAGKNALITGGAGFLGSNLAKKLVELDANVTLFLSTGKDKKNVADIENKIKIIEGNLTNDADVLDAVKNKDYIFHFAWQSDLKKSMLFPKEDLMTDILSLLNLLEVYRKENPNVKIIFPSTPTVVGYAENLKQDETPRENPLSIYEANKLMAEKYLQVYYKNYNLKFCVLRMEYVYSRLTRFIKLRVRKKGCIILSLLQKCLFMVELDKLK